jgi:hypothetical protein
MINIPAWFCRESGVGKRKKQTWLGTLIALRAVPRRNGPLVGRLSGYQKSPEQGAAALEKSGPLS